MSNVISLPSTAPGRVRTERTGLLRAVVAAFHRGHDLDQLRGMSDHCLRDIGLARKDVATIAWPSGSGLMPPGARP